MIENAETNIVNGFCCYEKYNLLFCEIHF